MSDSEALRRNRCFGVLGCDSVSAAASSSFKIRVVCDRCFGVLGCDSEALRRNRLKLVVCDI